MINKREPILKMLGITLLILGSSYLAYIEKNLYPPLIALIMLLIFAYIKLLNRKDKEPLTNSMSKDDFFKVYSKCIHNNNKKYMMLRIGIKNFNNWNIENGDQYGDMILKKVYELLKGCLKNDEYICRTYGDNFLILKRFENIEDAHKKIIELDDAVYLYEGDLFRNNLFLSIGAFIMDDENVSFNSAVHKANMARIGNDDYKGYNSSFAVYGYDYIEKNDRTEHIKNKMEYALKNEEFIIYVQPKHKCENGSIIGGELLVRWFDKEEGLIPLNECMPVFDSTGFIRYVDLYMFEAGLQMIQYWLDNDIPPICLSVNVSQLNFIASGVFFDNINRIFSKYSVPAEYIEMELTENIAVIEENKLIGIIEKIKSMGFRCSIDDFGSAYSSLNILKRLNVHAVKLDKKMFDNCDNDRGRIIVSGCIQMAKKLEMDVVAEGVETKEDVDFLKENGCDMIQGYYFSKPMPRQEFVDLYQKQIV